MDQKRRTAQSPQRAAEVLKETDAARARAPDKQVRRDPGEVIEIETGDRHPFRNAPDFGDGPR